jgi:hypothetical protein
MLQLGAHSHFQSRVLSRIFVATLFVVVPSSLGLVRSVTLYPLSMFVMEKSCPLSCFSSSYCTVLVVTESTEFFL